MLCHPRRANIPFHVQRRRSQILTASSMEPPVFPPPLIVVLVAPLLHISHHVFEWFLILRGLWPVCGHAKVNDPSIRSAPAKVLAICPGSNDIFVRPSTGVCRKC